MYLNTKGKYGKVKDTEIKWSIISKSVLIIIFVDFIDQLIDYPINCASLIAVPHRTVVVTDEPLFCGVISYNSTLIQYFRKVLFRKCGLFLASRHTT